MPICPYMDVYMLSGWSDCQQGGLRVNILVMTIRKGDCPKGEGAAPTRRFPLHITSRNFFKKFTSTPLLYKRACFKLHLLPTGSPPFLPTVSISSSVS